MPVLCLIIAMLPNLKELYLGGSRMISFPFFRDFDNRFNWDNPNISRLASLLSGKLTHLELFNFEIAGCPCDFCLNEPPVCHIVEYFPNLEWLPVCQGRIYSEESFL